MQEENERLKREEVFERDEIELSEKEESYRRGFSQGFLAARENEDITVKEVYRWRHSKELTAPPGSILAGKVLSGLKKNEEHRFFINKLKKCWND